MGEIAQCVHRGGRARLELDHTIPVAADYQHAAFALAGASFLSPRVEESRLKAGCSQDWLPHKLLVRNGC
jgi:hypothetical protein